MKDNRVKSIDLSNKARSFHVTIPPGISVSMLQVDFILRAYHLKSHGNSSVLFTSHVFTGSGGDSILPYNPGIVLSASI